MLMSYAIIWQSHSVHAASPLRCPADHLRGAPSGRGLAVAPQAAACTQYACVILAGNGLHLSDRHFITHKCAVATWRHLTQTSTSRVMTSS